MFEKSLLIPTISIGIAVLLTIIALRIDVFAITSGDMSINTYTWSFKFAEINFKAVANDSSYSYDLSGTVSYDYACAADLYITYDLFCDIEWHHIVCFICGLISILLGILSMIIILFSLKNATKKNLFVLIGNVIVLIVGIFIFWVDNPLFDDDNFGVDTDTSLWFDTPTFGVTPWLILIALFCYIISIIYGKWFGGTFEINTNNESKKYNYNKKQLITTSFAVVAVLLTIIACDINEYATTTRTLSDTSISEYTYYFRLDEREDAQDVEVNDSTYTIKYTYLYDVFCDFSSSTSDSDYSLLLGVYCDVEWHNFVLLVCGIISILLGIGSIVILLIPLNNVATKNIFLLIGNIVVLVVGLLLFWIENPVFEDDNWIYYAEISTEFETPSWGATPWLVLGAVLFYLGCIIYGKFMTRVFQGNVDDDESTAAVVNMTKTNPDKMDNEGQTNNENKTNNIGTTNNNNI